MTGSLPPERLDELLAGYALGDLSPEEIEVVERLLVERPQLKIEAARLQKVMALLPYALPEVQPPSQLRDRLLAAATQPASRRERSPRFSAWSWSPMIASVAAIATVAVGLDNYRLRQELGQVQAQMNQQAEIVATLQQPASRFVSLQGPQVSAASGSVVLDAQNQKLVIAAQQLPPLPDNQIYRLWAVVDDQKIACGDFNTSSEGTVSKILPISVDVCNSQRAKLVVTQEPFPAPSQPVGNAVLISAG
ncbi:MAG TPA: anti-sigma factor [Candidatus Obscuribacterales bacterium]